MDEISLASEFPAAEDDWLTLAIKALAGAPFEALRAPLYEGFETDPLYTRRDSPKGGAVTAHRGWEIIQPVAAGTLANAKSRLAEDLVEGANAVGLEFDGRTAQGDHPLQSLSDFDALFGAFSPQIESYYLNGNNVMAAATLFAAFIERKGTVARGAAGLDPLTDIAVSGEIPANRGALFADAADAAFYLKNRHPRLTPFLASDRAWHGAGGAVTHELAFTLAAAVTYWRALTEAGMPLQDSASCIGFRLTASADIFLTIAKFRAIRLLWRKAMEVASTKPDGQVKVIAEMSPRMLSEYDSHVNLLRGTSAAFGAAIGGATAIRIFPFDAVSSQPGLLSRRLARNTGLILQHETNLRAVGDAGAGSFYLESLTDRLAGESWALFREVEAQGGLAAALENGFVKNRLDPVSSERDRAVARRMEKIIGVSAFPNLGEKTAVKGTRSSSSGESISAVFQDLTLPPPGKGERFAALVSAAKTGATLHKLQRTLRSIKDFTGMALPAGARFAEPFEILRRQSDLALNHLGSRPPIFLAVLGNAEGYRERASWAQNFFAAGGIETVLPGGGFDEVDRLAAAFKENPSPVACLCASDAAYAQMKGAALALKKAGALFLYIVAQPTVLGTLDPAEANACDRLIYDGCDALAVLQEAHRILRVSELAQQSEEDGGM